jgi:hypothetical protein
MYVNVWRTLKKGKMNINLVTGYDITVDEIGSKNSNCYGGINTSPYFDTPYWNSSTGNINQIAINEIKSNFILNNQY